MEIRFDNVSYLDKIKNMTYTFCDNKITTIIGESGSGKTLISYLITGLINPSEGTITIGNNVIDKNTKDFKDIRRDIGYVFQNPEEQFFTNSVKEELEFSLKKYKYRLDKLDKRVIDALKLVGLPLEYLTRSPFSLSGGEKEKLSIAIALSLNPKVLILDEPTVYLDDKSVNDLVSLLIKLRERYHKTIIILTNDNYFLEQVSDKILLIKNGKIKLDIFKEEFIDNIDKIKKSGLEIPKILEFITFVEKNKNIKLTHTLDMGILIREIANEYK